MSDVDVVFLIALETLMGVCFIGAELTSSGYQVNRPSMASLLAGSAQ